MVLTDSTCKFYCTWIPNRILSVSSVTAQHTNIWSLATSISCITFLSCPAYMIKTVPSFTWMSLASLFGLYCSSDWARAEGESYASESTRVANERSRRNFQKPIVPHLSLLCRDILEIYNLCNSSVEGQWKSAELSLNEVTVRVRLKITCSETQASECKKRIVQ